MADINCGVCAEPWENFELRKEFNSDGQNWTDLNAALGDKVGDSKETPYSYFMKGKGCPACEFGAKKPIFTGQAYKAKHEIPGLGINKGDLVLVRGYDQEHGSFDMNVTFEYGLANENSTEMDEKMFRRQFELVPSQADKERDEEIFLKAAESACEASDEDPVEILARRGIV